MQHIFRALSKMVVILVLLFGNPPPVSLRQLARRPAVALVSTGRHPLAGGPPPLGLPASADPPREGRAAPAAGGPGSFAPAGEGYLPVRAA